MQPGNPIVGGVVLRRPAITSPNYATGVSGWTVNQDGSAEFNSVTIRNGQVVSGTQLFYDGTPGPGTLVASISVNSGTDPYGNTYPAGISWAGVPSNRGVITGNQLLAGKTSALAMISNTNGLDTDQAWSIKVGVETGNRLVVFGSGEHDWSDGTSAADVTLGRTAAGILGVGLADFAITTAGKGLKIKEGTNGRMGEVSLVTGTKTVANTTVTNNTRIFLQRHTAGGTIGDLTYTRSAGVSFTINSASATDTSLVNYVLIEVA